MCHHCKSTVEKIFRLIKNGNILWKISVSQGSSWLLAALNGRNKLTKKLLHIIVNEFTPFSKKNKSDSHIFLKI